MAKDAVDAVAHGLDGKVPESCTDQIALVGGDGLPGAVELPPPPRGPLRPARRAHRAPPAAATARSSTTCWNSIAERPDLGQTPHGADDYLRAEIVYAATHEGARHLNDVLARRTRISIETWDRGVGVAREAADLLAPVLGWSKEQTEREIEYYEKRVEAERVSQTQEGDQEADAHRRGAPDIVPTA